MKPRISSRPLQELAAGLRPRHGFPLLRAQDGSCRAWRCAARHAPPRRHFGSTNPRRASQPADDPAFRSIVDNPPELVRSGRPRHTLGLAVLAIIPITAFALGCWQVQRLGWKTRLMAVLEDRLVREPLVLPAHIGDLDDPDAAADALDYRRVILRGRFRHEGEMLVGPRMRDGEQGYSVVTPFEREGGDTVLVNRGWLSKKFADRASRKGEDALPEGETFVLGLIRKPWKKNFFTPENQPDKGEWYFPDVKQMAEVSGTAPVFIEALMGTCGPWRICLRELGGRANIRDSARPLQVLGLGGTRRSNWACSRGQLAQQPCAVHIHLVRLWLATPCIGRCTRD